MGYTIVNGPTVMSCSADPIVTANVQLVYDDVNSTVKNVEIAINDIIRVKYMGGEYSPIVLEAEGRLDRFSVLKTRNGKIYGTNPITDTLGQIKTLEIDASSENNHNVIAIPVAAIREIEVIRKANGENESDNETVKPDCEHPGAYCPNNPSCTCPGYVQPEVDCPLHDQECEIDIDGDGTPDVFIDDSGITQEQLDAWLENGYVCVYKGTPYKDLQDAIDQVKSPCRDIDMDSIIIFDEIFNEESTVYTVTGPCIIRSIYNEYGPRYINGAFNVNSTETVVFHNLAIRHKGVGKELVAIDSVNASVSISRCKFVLDPTFELSDSAVELPMAIRVTRMADDTKEYQPVCILNNTFANYPELELNGAHSTAICFTRNFGDIYGDFRYEVNANEVQNKYSKCPHILFSDQNFNNGTDDKTLECSGIVYTKEGLKDMLQYQGVDTFIDIAGTIDLDLETFSISVANTSKLVISGMLNLGNNNINNFGSVCNAGIVTGGTIINNGTITYSAEPGQNVDFYNTKVRSNGSQRILKAALLENEYSANLTSPDCVIG